MFHIITTISPPTSDLSREVLTEVSCVSPVRGNVPAGFQRSAAREGCAKRLTNGVLLLPHFKKEIPHGDRFTVGGAVPSPTLYHKIMESSINNQSGGTTAQTPNINPNQQPNSNTKMKNTNDDPITLKQAATEFECAWTSLKNNIKSSKLAATQAGVKAPYMVRPSDVERFLRATPGIASIFHPADSKPIPSVSQLPSATDMSPVMTHQKSERPESQETGKGKKSKSTAPSNVAAAADNSNDSSGDGKQLSPVSVAQEDSSTQPAPVGGKRNRRGRGKGGRSPAPCGIQQPVLKALAGTTPQDRLRITACLTALVGLVASA